MTVGPIPLVVNPCCNHNGVVLSLREGNATARFYKGSCWLGRRVAVQSAGAAAGPNAADRRADGLCGERSDCAVLAGSVPGGGHEARLDRKQQGPDRTSLDRR